MNTFELVMAALQMIVTMAQNPALGLSTSGAKIAKLVSFVITLGQAGAKGNAELVKLNDSIKALDAAGGPIPDSFWNDLDSRHASAKARIAAA